MNEEFQTFEECIKRLEYSFIKVIKYYKATYVDFQHPSIRDMLLILLRNNPIVRKLYIINASAHALSFIIDGILFFGRNPDDSPHKLVLSTKEDLSLLIERIKIVVKESITFFELSKILSSATRVMKSFNKMQLNSSDKKQFLDKPGGLLLKTIVETLCLDETFNTKKSYNCRNWSTIVEKFYLLSSFFSNLKLPYLTKILNLFRGEKILGCIPLLKLINTHRPSLFNKIFNEGIDKTIYNYILDVLNQQYERGLEFEDYIGEFDYEEFDSWHSECEEYIDEFLEFFSFSSYDKPTEFDDLEAQMEDISPPENLEEDDLGSDEIDREEPYWTIDRIFEDL